MVLDVIEPWIVLGLDVIEPIMVGSDVVDPFCWFRCYRTYDCWWVWEVPPCLMLLALFKMFSNTPDEALVETR